MEILIIWIVSIIASIGLEVSQALNLIKDIADSGYKINIEKLSEIHKQIKKCLN